MKREIVQDLVQFLGMIGIIGSLIFVGLQMQQTQQIAIAGQVQARAEMGVNRILNGLEGNLDANRLFNYANFDYEELNEEEKLIARNMHNWIGIMVENNFSQYQMGLFADDYWEQQERRILNWWNRCDLRSSGGRIRSFQNYLDSLPDECAE
ncbi:MAG: hypothetical protein CMQ07_08745 [Gammaproteobacteria bacterium]|nr:hypothetical protein [Gammaproteobacteria bacterium]|tara:strand:+ start:44 stop:499 length:456 start_codon:yes stop_codon:yes gene_type:complete